MPLEISVELLDEQGSGSSVIISLGDDLFNLLFKIG
jgi:hypothetical protein